MRSSMAPSKSPNRPGKAPLAIYANYCEIGHNALEFLIDFGQFRPEDAVVHFHSRIVSGPVQTKLFARLLCDAIDRYEADHGAIAELQDNDDPLEALLASIPDFERRAMIARTEPRPYDGRGEPPERASASSHSAPPAKSTR